MFSDQAVFEREGDMYFWLDTPGHVDFRRVDRILIRSTRSRSDLACLWQANLSPEMERAIAAMDYAVVVVSCVEGVQSHTETVWNLLEKRSVPAFFFVNKVDRAGADRGGVLFEIRERLSRDAVELTGFPGTVSPALAEAVAERDEALLDLYLQGRVDLVRLTAALKREIMSRALFPVFYGAALTGEGIDAFLAALFCLTDTDYASQLSAPISARIYKVRHDLQGTRVCFFKVLAGCVRVRGEVGGLKLTELRRYHGARYKPVLEAEAGDLCAAVGITDAKPEVRRPNFNSFGAPREPLRHYAEVHVRLVPGPRGSGIRFESLCHVDDLALGWQRLVETHVFEKRHRGVLIGAPLADVAVQLLIGRAHLKHTEGGDFRQATYRAIRCALMNAESAILEPWCAFSVRAPAELYGKIMGDLLRMRARCRSPVCARDIVTIEGEAAFREIAGYGTELTALAHGRGNLAYHRLDHYERAADEAALVKAFGYDPVRADTPDSVFCAKGAGFNVGWRDVAVYAHCKRDDYGCKDD